MSDIPTDAMFALKNGQNTSDRLETDLIAAIVETLVTHGITFNGKKCEIKPFGTLGFDIKGVDGFDHIEFKLVKTGWGREF